MRGEQSQWWWCYWQAAGTADGINADIRKGEHQFVNKEQEGGREKGREII